MEIKNKIEKHDGSVFFHIILVNEKQDSIMNIREGDINPGSWVLNGGEIHIIYRLGGGVDYQLIIDFFGGCLNKNLSRNNSKFYNYIEQYFPVPQGFEFMRKAIKVLEKVHYKHEGYKNKNGVELSMSDGEFSSLVKEGFENKIKTGEWNKNICDVCGKHIYCNYCKRFTWENQNGMCGCV